MIRVRAASPDDVPTLIGIARHSVTASQWQPSEYERIFAQDPVHNRVALVIEDDAGVCGFIVGHEAASEWEIENVAVQPAARRRGLGSRLLGEFIDLVRQRGGTAVFLEVRESNRAARALYEKWAFTELARRKSYYQDPSEDALILGLSFPQKG